MVQVGTTVEFLNSDKVAHNIFWPSVSGNKKLSHNMGTWPTGQKRDFKFDTPGVVPLLCNVHPEMSGVHHRVANAVFRGNRCRRQLQDQPTCRTAATRSSAWHEGMKVQSKPVNGRRRSDGRLHAFEVADDSAVDD